jgi:hypothetical protein
MRTIALARYGIVAGDSDPSGIPSFVATLYDAGTVVTVATGIASAVATLDPVGASAGGPTQTLSLATNTPAGSLSHVVTAAEAVDIPAADYSVKIALTHNDGTVSTYPDPACPAMFSFWER